MGTDLFKWNKQTYLLIVDYYSRFIEIARLSRPTAEQVIHWTKSIFVRHGIPEILISDNGPQFGSEMCSEFAKEYQFQHLTSSPYFPQSNGEAERAVGTVKRLLNRENDPYLALMAYRATPLQNGYSPAELLMSQRLRTTVPITRSQRQPKMIDTAILAGRDHTHKKCFWCYQQNCQLLQFFSRKKHLLDLCRTRWMERHKALETFNQFYTVLVTVFEDISTKRSGWNSDTITDACGLLSAITTPQFIMAFIVAWKGLAMVKGLSNCLQSTSYDIIKAHRHIQHTKVSVHTARKEVDGIHSEWYILAREKAESVGVDFMVLPCATVSKFRQLPK